MTLQISTNLIEETVTLLLKSTFWKKEDILKITASIHIVTFQCSTAESIFSQIAEIIPKLIFFSNGKFRTKRVFCPSFLRSSDRKQFVILWECPPVHLYIYLYILYLFICMYFLQVLLQEWEKWFSIFTQILCYECVKERKYLLNMFDLYFSF